MKKVTRDVQRKLIGRYKNGFILSLISTPIKLSAKLSIGEYFSLSLFQTLIGNVVTSSPISDMNPLLAALGAEVELMSMDQGKSVSS